jgi:hypothetical protein
VVEMREGSCDMARVGGGEGGRARATIDTPTTEGGEGGCCRGHGRWAVNWACGGRRC